MAADLKLTSSMNYSDVHKKVPLVIRETASSIKNTFSKDTRKPDALDAVKLDPAVLEAQVTVHTKDRCLKHPEARKDELLSPQFKRFEEMVSQQEAALLSLTPYQLNLLMRYVEVLRTQRRHPQKYVECAFCKNNGQPLSWYTSHALRDVHGRVRCPVLRGFHCPRCRATGDLAHTIKYCPEKGKINYQERCSV